MKIPNMTLAIGKKMLDTEKIYDIFLYICLALFTGYVGFISLGKGLDFSVMQSTGGGDGTFALTLIKGIQENGVIGLFFNPRIGTPDVSSLIDYPVLDIFMATLLWIISLFTESTFAILYKYYILTFAVDSVAMAILLRKLNINRIVSFVSGAIFTFVPFHFLRGMGHSSLINYMFFPIVVYLSLCILGYLKEEKIWVIIFMAALLGFGYGYYYAFGLIVMTIAVIMRFCKEMNVKNLLYYIWIPGITLISVFFNLLPKIIYASVNGANELVGVRDPIEQEIYGLKIIQLLFPPSYTRFDILKVLYTEYSSKAPLVNENGTSALGFVAGLGFIVLCVLLIYSFCAKDKCKGKEWELVDFSALSTLVLVLMGTIGGFGIIFNWFVTPQIRCYNRSSIYIAGFAVIMVAVLLDKIRLQWNWVTFLICFALLAFSMYDTVLINSDNWQDGIRPIQKMYETYFNEIEDVLDDGDMVYQLPYLDFPEVSSTYDYKHFIGYIYTDTLKWSYGGVKGRNIAAKDLLLNDGKSFLFLRFIKEAGFKAVYIDLDGYEDGGESVLSFYNELGIEPLVSSDGKLYLFDIRNLDTDGSKYQVGYSFVEKWNETYDMGVSEEELGKIALELGEHNQEAYRDLFEMISDSDIVDQYSNEQYVDFLYAEILGRQETQEEQAIWTGQLEAGVSREDVFCSFLDSSEFRVSQGYDVVEE